MTRGNQRENDRAKALKKAGNSKNKTQMSGSEFARAKEDAAAIMREKQRKGMYLEWKLPGDRPKRLMTCVPLLIALL
ncbi:hypothetical protein N7461_008047 [Penicillium sp. DV-2018c]|nr:hypothetical protein N7461_008047 [Penicillium sp. DV-2018c]